MAMPEATKEQLEYEVRHAFRDYAKMGWSVPVPDFNPTIKEIMETVVKAWIFGRDTGYREARDDSSNGVYFN